MPAEPAVALTCDEPTAPSQHHQRGVPSRSECGGTPETGELDEEREPHDASAEAVQQRGGRSSGAAGGQQIVNDEDALALAEDRKSTRLNSSHVKISYA